jgi:ribokinase
VSCDVVVAGSVNVDLVVTVERLPDPGETVTGGTFERHGGGKGANQAVAAARAGASVAFIGAVGDDDLGTEAVAQLDAEGIDTSSVASLAETATGVALIIVDAHGENEIAVASGANSFVDEAMVRAALGSRSFAQSTVFGTNLEISDDAVRTVCSIANEAGMQVLVNPAPARELPEDVLSAGPILTPNESEARALSGEDSAEAAGRALAERTRQAVIVTLGRRGALLVRGDEARHFDAFAVDAVDTTGAGDAFNGVLASQLARGIALDEAIPYAMAGTALAVTVSGARDGMPSLGEVESLIARS